MRKLTIGLLLVAACGGSTVDPPSTQPPATAAPATAAPATAAATDQRLPGSNLTADDWQVMALVANDPAQADLCDQFEVLYLHEMVDGYREGFNSVGGTQLNELDTLVVLATTFAIHCPESADMFWAEIEDQYPTATVFQFELLFEALADALRST